MLHYLLPSELVVSFALNLDTIVYLLLLTIFNPILIWVLVHFEKVSVQSAIFVDVLWIIRALNLHLKTHKYKTKTILITGGANGLGYQIVKQLCLKDDVENIIVVDLQHRCELDTMKKVRFVKFDFRTNIEELQVELKDVDIMICNAGMRQQDSILALTSNDIINIIKTNWVSHMLLIKKFIQFKKQFHVISIGSVLGYVGPKNLGVYAGSKNALLSTMESLRAENPDGIFTTVLPGQLNSQMFADVEVNEFLAPVIDIVKLAKRVVYIVNNGIDGDLAFPLYGRLLPIYRVLPFWLQKSCRWYSGMDDV